MKIGFDAQLFLSGNKTGIGWCADNILKELSKDKEFECICDYFTSRHKHSENNVKFYEKYGAKMNPCNWFHSVIYKLIWPFIPVPYSLFFAKDRDITQFFNFVIPPGVSGKKVTIVHDMAYKAYPETLNRKNLKWLQLTLKRSCKRADAIVTVSEFSKNEIVKYLHIRSDKIVVMPNGVDLTLYHPNYSFEQIDKVKMNYNIDGSYFLYLGTLEPRKNIERLIEAYVNLINKYKSLGVQVPKLVLAGGKGWMYDTIFETVNKFNMKDNIIFTGYVDEKEVPLLMSGAEAFVFPSLYEGFGMPVLEAMACGTLVITSNTSSLPEVAGDAGILVNPESVVEIQKAMQSVVENPETFYYKRELGVVRASKYTWENSVKILKEVYRELEERK